MRTLRAVLPNGDETHTPGLSPAYAYFLCQVVHIRNSCPPITRTQTNAMGRHSRRGRTSCPGTFDPSDRTRVKHTKIGVWDLYEEIDTARAPVPDASYAERAFAAYECLPYLVRMIRNVLAIRSCWFLLAAYALAEGVQALLPAASLWYVLGSSRRSSLEGGGEGLC